MDIYDVRRANLKWLIEHEYEGVTANLARDLQMQASYLSRIFSRNPQHKRNVGSRLARTIEQVAKKRRGWMDEPHFSGEPSGQANPDTKGTKAVVLTPFGDKMVPIVDYVQAWQWTASPKPYPLTDRTEVIWTRMSKLSERAFALVVEGESMADEFYPGDTVIVDSEVGPRPGDFVVAKMEKDETVIFRKYRPRGADKAGKPIIELAPLNDDYPTTIINSGNAGSIIATMVEHRKYRRTERLSAPEHHVVKGSKA